jgi:FixJ family two-component response regulator
MFLAKSLIFTVIDVREPRPEGSCLSTRERFLTSKSPLTRRELEICNLIRNGMRNREIQFRIAYEPTRPKLRNLARRRLAHHLQRKHIKRQIFD